MADDFKPIFHDLDGRTVKVYAISDVHIGSREYDDGFERFVQSIAKDPDAYIVLCGDLIDNAVPSGRTPVFDDCMTPGEAVDEVVRILKPVSIRILGMVSGNHEERTKRAAGIDPSEVIAVKLGIEDLYRDNMAFIRVRLCKNGVYDIYNLFLHHGKTRNKLDKFVRGLENIDVSFTGHTHIGEITKPCRIVFTQRGIVQVKPMVSVVATSWVKYGGYAAAAMYPANATSDPQHVVLEFTGTNSREGSVKVVW